MATSEQSPRLTGKILLDTITREAKYTRRDPQALFRKLGLSVLGYQVSNMRDDLPQQKYLEWRAFAAGVTLDDGGIVQVADLPEEYLRFGHVLQDYEQALLMGSLADRDTALEDLILLGQEILRRSYFAALRYPGKEPRLTVTSRLIVETGADAIQKLGRAPAGPKYPYRKFSRTDHPGPESLGIEILSSGAFPDWSDPPLARLLASRQVKRAGFEVVLMAAQDTPRARVLARALEEGRDVGPLVFPMYNRLMLDLELMRLGQATTPGTYNMLLSSFYHGALFVDHSANVSEQVQLIYDEENWKPAYTFRPGIPGGLEEQGAEAARGLLSRFFKTKSDSPIGRDHPREARIQFNATDDFTQVSRFLDSLVRSLDGGVTVKGKTVRRNGEVHTLLPVLRLDGRGSQKEIVSRATELVASAGLRQLALTAEAVRRAPGILQYFSSAEEADSVLGLAASSKVRLRDGRTIDMAATANKAVEAAAGAIQSGQGCVKIGLLGLTLEEMHDFVVRVKKGLNATYRREENRCLVFIGIVDEPMVTAAGVITEGFAVCTSFLDLMRRVQHDYLLLDTMHKAEEDKRLVDAGDAKGGHLTSDQLRSLVQTAHESKVDLWVAGSFTEEQVYETAKNPPETRPSLICLGGAGKGHRRSPPGSRLRLFRRESRH